MLIRELESNKNNLFHLKLLTVELSPSQNIDENIARCMVWKGYSRSKIQR